MPAYKAFFLQGSQQAVDCAFVQSHFAGNVTEAQTAFRFRETEQNVEGPVNTRTVVCAERSTEERSGMIKPSCVSHQAQQRSIR